MKGIGQFAILVLLVSTAAPSESPQGHAQSGKTAEARWSTLTASMENMHAAMAAVAPSGDSDVDFVRLMLPHHQAAIDMAKTQILYGKDPQMRRLAQEIITDQQSEIELMRLWLKQREANSRQLDPRTPPHASQEQ